MFKRGRQFRNGRSGVNQPDPDDLEPVDPGKARTAARNTAIGLLSRREHAQAEIKRKLRDRGYDDAVALEVVDELTRQRLLSDARFAEMFIRSRAARGQGPVRLRGELRQLQLSAELIEQHLDAAEVDWVQLAVDIRQRKFGGAFAKTMSERAKQVRFLQYRGFTTDQIRIALGTSCADELLESGDGNDLPDHAEY
ncbi:MAG: regulatory protein RecX [Steroidobacteraceae bacterium]